MLKNISQLESHIEQKSYRFMCDCDSPLTHVKEALFQFLKLVGQIEDKVKAEQESMALQAKSQEEPLEVKQQE